MTEASGSHMRWAMLALAAVVIAWPVPYLDAIRSPNELVRVYLIRAIVDDRTITIDSQVQRYGPLNDMAERGGHLYSDKAPGLSALGVPVYAALRAFRPADRISNRELVRWLRFFLLVAPTIVLMIVLSRWLDALGLSRDLVNVAPLAYVLATPAFPYALVFMSHQAAAWMVGAALAAAWTSRTASAPAIPLSAAGLLSGLAAITEYPTLPMAAAVGVLAFAGARRSRHDGMQFAAAAAIPIVFAAAYHGAAFGGPLTTGYGFLVNPEFREIYRTGLMGISVPSREALAGIALGRQRGLLALAPWLALAPFGLLAFRDRATRPLVCVLAFSVFLHLWVAAGYQYWVGGWSVGPRHLVPALPALAVLAILGWEKIRRSLPSVDPLCRGLVIASALAVCAVSFTYPGFPEELNDPLFQLTLPMLRDRQFSASLPFLAGIRSDLAMMPAIVAAAAVILYIASGAPSAPAEFRTAPGRFVVPALMAAGFFVTLWIVRPVPSCAAQMRVEWLRHTVWEPKDVAVASAERSPDCANPQ